MRAVLMAAGIAAMVGLVSWLSAGSARAVPSADAGADLAARWCAACHVVAPSGAGTDAAPSFPSIARKRSADELRLFLASPHARPMRGFNLTTREIEDVVAYIETLERPPGSE